MEIRDFTSNFLYTTARLYGDPDPSGNSTVGTGFYFGIVLEHEEICLFIVTNKHVIQGQTHINFVMNYADSEFNRLDEQKRCRIELADNLYPHLDPNVDLCMIDITSIITETINEGRDIFYRAFDIDSIPIRSTLDEFNALEDVVMIGYPHGLWDSANNLPIMRKGITASHVSYDHRGQEVFLVDIACYHGSSGSPLLIYKDEKVIRQGNPFATTRALVLGIQFSVPQINNNDVSVYSYSNLGYFIKSYKLIDIITDFKRSQGIY